MYEGKGDYVNAIKYYLQLEVDSTPDVDLLEEAYEKAAELAYKFVPGSAAEVVSTVRFVVRVIIGEAEICSA